MSDEYDEVATAEYEAEWRRMVDSGQCPHSGMTIRWCQGGICDCFDVPRAEATPLRTPLPATPPAPRLVATESARISEPVHTDCPAAGGWRIVTKSAIRSHPIPTQPGRRTRGHAMNVTEAEARVALIVKILAREGGAPGNNIHSWRCEYPERYGREPCDCLAVVARQIVTALDAAKETP